MILLEKTCEVVEVLQPSRSPAFYKVQPGDLIHFSVPLQAVGYRHCGTKAAYIRCLNLQNDQESSLTFNQLGNVMKRIVLIQTDLQFERSDIL